MIFEQFYLECLSQASYLIGDPSSGRAVVVDPRRDVGVYLDSASEHGLTIEMAIETHFHADFLSGHLEMVAATGAEIAYGSVAETEFDSRKLAHGEVIDLGQVALEIRHTPGHTPESISVVVYEHGVGGEPYAVLTGDTLFVGDVGRPDLLSSKGVTSEWLANSLYESLHGQLLTLPDTTRVYPGHGAGSACGKNLSSDTWSTIGDQRSGNYALAPMSAAEFVDVVTAGQSAPPSYFSYDAELNRENRPLLDELMVPPTFGTDAVIDHVAGGGVLLDTRDPETFASGHIAGSINVGLGGRFAEFAGGVLDPSREIVLITEPGKELESKNRLARIGYDRVVGALVDPQAVMSAFPDVAATLGRVDVAEFDESRTGHEVQVLDVRQPGETEGGIVDGAFLAPLTKLHEGLAELDKSKPVLVYCAGGYRSAIAASEMLAVGFTDVRDLRGGYGAWSGAQACSGTSRP